MIEKLKTRLSLGGAAYHLDPTTMSVNKTLEGI
jgi:hypothetical protein